VTESLTTDLSRISGSFVVARKTAFTYKGKSFDVKQIGRELNVRYLLEGSVQRSANRLRVNVQLIDADSGTHYGQNVSIKLSPTSSICKTRLLRDWPTSWARS
jgi:TolB-like protein